ncbi:transmembrane protein 177 [Xylocopa sonorina]|uniref:transmembrane protein 177 n=1 Tax=Xylocopa sonorina TaxID=1818115 RepID=UPI00403B3072
MMQKLLKVSLLAGVAGIHMLPQTVLLDTRRKFRARYGFDHKEVPIQENIQKRIVEVMDDLHLSEKERNAIKFFNVHDVDVYHAGLTQTGYGAIVGIPVNFEYQDVQSITDQTISLQYVSIDWSTEPAKQFRESLVLSENAQKFAIAWNILSVKYPDLYMMSTWAMNVLVVFAILDMALLSPYITKNRRLKVISIWIVVLVALHGSTNLIDSDHIQTINEILAVLGPEYIQGGIEYYEKLSKRNKALRILLGKRGEYLFTTDGSKISWFDINIPISRQLTYFNRALQIVTT